MKITVKMKCWDGKDNVWSEIQTFQGNNFHDIDCQIYESQDWENGNRVEDYEILETA
jgi:hypothetical protein